MKNFKSRILLPGLIALAGLVLLALMLIYGEEEEIVVIPIKPLSVETLAVKKSDYRIKIPAWGFIEPADRMKICAEISGRIIKIPENIFTGAKVKKGDRLFKIDDRTFQNTHKRAVAETNLVKQSLEIEKGKQAIARKEWHMLKKSEFRGMGNGSLALRQPQLKEREAAVQIAMAKVSQAALDLERTKINSPCNGVILSESIGAGQVIEPGFIAMEIASTDFYRISALFSPNYSVDTGIPGVGIKTGGKRFEGTIKAVSPEICAKTRHKKVIVEFKGDDVTLGAYVKLLLPGHLFEDVIVIPGEALRSENSVWVLSRENTLKIRSVQVLGKDSQNTVIGKGLRENDKVILTHIASPLNGMNLSASSVKEVKSD